MLITRIVVSICSVGLVVLNAGVVFGQDYPNKPVRLVTGAAGGGSDFTARQIAQGISGSLGQPVIIDNRGGTLRFEIVAKAAPDGYTLLLTGDQVWIIPLIQNTRYDPTRDFAPITTIDTSPNILAAHPAVPVT